MPEEPFEFIGETWDAPGGVIGVVEEAWVDVLEGRPALLARLRLPDGAAAVVEASDCFLHHAAPL